MPKVNKKENAIGYYRYTDIMFEWHKVVPDDLVEPLKAFLYPACITHPNNPLVNGGPGLELALGTFKANGETRMMYTSAQIEYIRYWLYEMGLTPRRISIPSSEYLVTADKFRSLTTQIYKDETALKKGQKDITKANKRLKGVDPDIQDRRDTFERVRNLYQGGASSSKATWCAIDIENWDRDHTEVTEFGYSLVQWENGEQVFKKAHWVVRGASRNFYVPDNRDYYLFGTTEAFTKKAFAEQIRGFLHGLMERGPLFLVFHDDTNDRRDLTALGVRLDGMNFVVPEKMPETGLYTVDTRRLFSALEGHKEPKSLERICRILGFRDCSRFHNAGNDAQYTFQCFVSMAAGEPIDTQRESRWPTRPADVQPNVKREYAREARPEDESDFEEFGPW